MIQSLISKMYALSIKEGQTIVLHIKKGVDAGLIHTLDKPLKKFAHDHNVEILMLPEGVELKLVDQPCLPGI